MYPPALPSERVLRGSKAIRVGKDSGGRGALGRLHGLGAVARHFPRNDVSIP